MSGPSFDTLIVPYDFSPEARRALAVALGLARRLDAKLHLVHASQPPKLAVPTSAIGGAGSHPVLDVGAWEREQREAIEEVANALDAPRGGAEAHVRSGTLTEAICAAAEELGADMIVMGTHARTGLAHVFLGSATERTVRHAPCPVLAVPVGDEDEGQDDAEATAATS